MVPNGVDFSVLVERIASELDFWRGFVQTARFLEQWVPDHRTAELPYFTHEFVTTRLPAGAKVLDVGSGAVSILRGTIPAENLTAADPLSPLYQQVFDYKAHGVKPPLCLSAENLGFKEEFDLVHISNALDHTCSPQAAFYSMWEAVKPGGYLFIEGFRDEGSHAGWNGMHQWNISVDGMALEIRDSSNRLHLSNVANVHADVKSVLGGRPWLIWVKQKTAG